MDLVSYLESRGYELMRQGNQYRLKEHDSLYVKGNQWYWHSQHKGGKTLDFLIDYEGMRSRRKYQKTRLSQRRIRTAILRILRR